MYLCFCGFNDEANYKEAYTRNLKAQKQRVTEFAEKRGDWCLVPHITLSLQQNRGYCDGLHLQL